MKLIQINIIYFLISVSASVNPDSACANVVLYSLKNESKELLNKFNLIRNKIASGFEYHHHNLPTCAQMMVFHYDKELEHIAESIAQLCTGNAADTEIRKKNGQLTNSNICVIKVSSNYEQVSTNLLISQGIDHWSKGMKHMSISVLRNYTYHKMYHDFTQLIWGATTHVGCSLIKYNAKPVTKIVTYQLVCTFYPAGNREGHVVYPFGLPGQFCLRSRNELYPSTCDKAASESQIKINTNVAFLLVLTYLIFYL